jgi:pimeloyl-ACP methyl ester carboxylesterase
MLRLLLRPLLRLLLRLFGLLLLVSALALPLLQAPDRSVESLVARWAPPPSEFIDLNGQLVHYRDVGPRDDPLPIVLLHGGSSSLHTWEAWAQALRGQRRVISLDLPAFGLTGPFTGPYAGQSYSGANYARFVLDVLDRLEVTRFVVAGNSLGGEVAWRIAAAVPQRVAQLVLVAAAGYPVVATASYPLVATASYPLVATASHPLVAPASHPLEANRSAVAMPLGWQIARLPVLGHALEYFLPRPLVVQGLQAVYGDPAKITARLVERSHELTLRAGNRAALVQRAQAWSPAEGVAQVSGVVAPTLVLWGGRDQIIPPALARRFAHDIPGARVLLFDDLGHVPQEEDPARTVAAVKAFLGIGAALVSAAAEPAASAASRPLLQAR